MTIIREAETEEVVGRVAMVNEHCLNGYYALSPQSYAEHRYVCYNVETKRQAMNELYVHLLMEQKEAGNG